MVTSIRDLLVKSEDDKSRMSKFLKREEIKKAFE